MARAGIPKKPPAWFLREWMAVAGLEGRGAQTKMRELTGWSAATMSQLYNGSQDFSPAILEAAAVALRVEPFELLIHPEKAMAMRDFKKAAQVIVGTPAPVAAEPADKRRTGTNG